MSRSLLKLQIGPVQEFIAQARSTRDLWSGSYLLSWLMATGLNELVSQAAKLSRSSALETEKNIIYPFLPSQPLYRLQRDRRAPPENRHACLIPSLPNLFVASLPFSASEAAGVARKAEQAMRAEWRNIAAGCWDALAADGLVNSDARAKFNRQVARFLSISWQATPWLDNYAATSQRNAWELDAVRQTRAFQGWATGGWTLGRAQNKDFLTGREEAICGGSEWWHACVAGQPRWESLFRQRHAGDIFGAITLIKRTWHSVYLASEPWSLRVVQDLPIPSTDQTARHDPDKDESSDSDSSDSSERHFAVLAMDGDEMGKWLSGKKEELPLELNAHQSFSAKLTEFAIDHAPRLVREHDGCLIYAGGDDAVALLPADTALACAAALRERFRKVAGFSLIDASAGVAIAHFASPFQDVVRAAQSAERRAKNELRRSSIAVTLFKGSGETVEWGCNWQSGGLELHDALSIALRRQVLSGKSPYRLLELIAPYLTQATPLLKERRKPTHTGDAAFASGFDEIVRNEFDTILRRQRGSNYPGLDRVQSTLLPLLDRYLAHLSREPAEARVAALMGLCEAVAFANRTAATASPEMQPA